MLTRWDPFQEMLNLRRTVDRLFDNVGTDHDWSQPTTVGFSCGRGRGQGWFRCESFRPRHQAG